MQGNSNKAFEVKELKGLKGFRLMACKSTAEDGTTTVGFALLTPDLVNYNTTTRLKKILIDLGVSTVDYNSEVIAAATHLTVPIPVNLIYAKEVKSVSED